MESLAQTKIRDILEKLRTKVSEIQAILMVGPDGLVDHILVDPALDIETIAGEYATLLRIAGRTSEDTRAGNLVEHIVVSDKSIVIARSVAPQHFVILLSRMQDQIGRARYELKQAAREVSAILPKLSL